METFVAEKDEHNRHRYVMITVTPQEACALIASLARQVERHDPNTGRLETFATGDLLGYVSISVMHQSHCIQCGQNNLTLPLKLEKGGFICQAHETHKEIGEREMNERLDKALGKINNE